MTRKLNFLVGAVLFMLFVLIANASEEQLNETYDSSYDDSSYDATTLELNETLVNKTFGLNDSNGTIHRNESVNITIINLTEYYNNEVNDEIILNNTLEINNTDAGIEENSASNTNETLDEALVATETDVSINVVEPEESNGNSVTASFGVWLTIIG